MPRKPSQRRPSEAAMPADQLIGATVVGERGQVVIPKEIRDRLGLVSGTRLIVMQQGDSPVMFLPVERMQKMVRQMSDYVDGLSRPRRSKQS